MTSRVQFTDESKWETYRVALLEYLVCGRFLWQLLFIFSIFGWPLSAFSVFWAANNTWIIIHVKKSRGRRTLAHSVRPSLRSKELTERWVCPFSCCEWRDHLSYPSTLPVARPGSRGGRWLSLLSFFTRLHHKYIFFVIPFLPCRSVCFPCWHFPLVAIL